MPLTPSSTLPASIKPLVTVIRVGLGVVGTLLIVDCVALMAVGKINFGTVVPFAIGVIFVAHAVYWRAIRDFISRKPLYKRVWYGLWLAFGVWLISFAVFAWTLQQRISQSHQPEQPVAAIIVLGAGSVDGKPTPTLAKRLDAAVPILNAQAHTSVITSGGVGIGRTRSEANIMATYLHETHNIPYERIIEEGRSTSTEENLLYSQPILTEQGISLTEPIAIVTSDFHTVRSAAIARHQGYRQPVTVASSTPLSIRYNSWFREYFAFVSGWLLGEY